MDLLNDFTLVVGVDAAHLDQLALTWPTWCRHKPSLLRRPMLIFYDRFSVSDDMIVERIGHDRLTTVPWPPPGIEFQGGEGKWNNPQRYKMLAGFVHVPALHVQTPYWLKIDTDVVATGQDDWIDQSWFSEYPAIVAHKWSFTKPPDQMDRLDAWVDAQRSFLYERLPLQLHPEPGASRVGHKRIISFVGFFRTEFTKICSHLANEYHSPCGLPVPSQDGFMWYVAKRMGVEIQRIDVKSRGWEHWSTDRNIREAVKRAMA